MTAVYGARGKSEDLPAWLLIKLLGSRFAEILPHLEWTTAAAAAAAQVVRVPFLHTLHPLRVKLSQGYYPLMKSKLHPFFFTAS